MDKRQTNGRMNGQMDDQSIMILQSKAQKTSVAIAQWHIWAMYS